MQNGKRRKKKKKERKRKHGKKENKHKTEDNTEKLKPCASPASKQQEFSEKEEEKKYPRVLIL